MKIVKKKVAKGADQKRVPFTIRTVVRRPATSTSSPLSTKRPIETTSSSNSSSFTGGRTGGSGFVVRKARPLDSTGRRVRLRDSLLARVQGKFRARSTTIKPDIEQKTERESTDKPKVYNLVVLSGTYEMLIVAAKIQKYTKFIDFAF